MKISIITINYNNKEGLLNTIKSIQKQTSNIYEYIVVDGNSIDGSVGVIKKYNDLITKWVSVDDTGIYNAMNKGVKLASGEYCLFLNAGDVLYSSKTIQNLNLQTFTYDFILGGVVSPQVGHIKAKPNLKLSDFYFGSIPHQSSIIRRQMLLDTPYDEKLRIVSDWKFALERIIFDQTSYKAISEIIAIEEAGGVSDGNSVTHSKERQTVLSDLLPKGVINDYNQMKFFYKKPFNIIKKYLWFLK